MDSLTNVKLITNKVEITNNYLPDGEYSPAPLIKKHAYKNGDAGYRLDLTFEITSREKAEFPVNIFISISGIFDLSRYPDEQRETFINVQAVQILFPYLRTMVTTLTAAAMLPPLVLPVVDVKSLFDESKKDK